MCRRIKAGIFPNLNYHLVIDGTGDSSNDQLFEAALSSLHFSKPTRGNIQSLYQHFGTELTFARADITDVIGISASPAGELIRKMREGGFIEAVTGQGKGKYRFIIK